MVDLEKSVLEWRQQMVAAGFEDSSLLEELESHLREDVERQMKSGATAEDAFEMAASRIGQAVELKQEFRKITGVTPFRERMKYSVLMLAGIPNQHLNKTMNASNPNTIIEPGWATYLKAALFVAPAVCIWYLALVGCVPAIKDVCQRARSASLPEFSRVNLGIAGLVTDNCLYLVGGVLLAVFLLEWRVSNWPRYRRAAVGLTAFIVNSSLLISLLLIIATGAIVARIAIQAAR